MHIEALGYQATAAAVGGTAATAVTGDSLVIKNARAGTRVWILANVVNSNAAAVMHQLVWPTAHDTTRNWRAVAPATQSKNLVPYGWPLEITPQETIAATIFAAAAVGDIESGNLLVYYEDFPGISGHLIDASELEQRMINQLTVQSTIAAGAGGSYTGAEAINAESDLLRANTDYALLGAVSQNRCCVIRVRAPDFGNVGVPIPGDPTEPSVTANWFLDLSATYGLPLIPVFNSANRANILIDVQQDENAAAVVESLILAELSPAGGSLPVLGR